MQSCSKPFTYALCLSELGHDIVHQYIGNGTSLMNLLIQPINRYIGGLSSVELISVITCILATGSLLIYSIPI